MVKKPFDELTITDNYMFQAVMRDPKNVKPLLEMIIGKKISRIDVAEQEKTVETGYNSRGIRMDVYVEDDEDTVYDIEMQASKKRHFDKRFRYYQSAIDVDIVNKGESVGKLKKSLIIFITTHDPQEIRQSEERRREYMSINVERADDKELGEYRGYVKSVRDSHYPDEILVDVLKIDGKTLMYVRQVLSEHPDWDDEEVAEEVLNIVD